MSMIYTLILLKTLANKFNVRKLNLKFSVTLMLISKNDMLIMKNVEMISH